MEIKQFTWNTCSYPQRSGTHMYQKQTKFSERVPSLNEWSPITIQNSQPSLFH